MNYFSGTKKEPLHDRKRLPIFFLFLPRMMFIPKLLGSPSRRESDIFPKLIWARRRRRPRAEEKPSFELECTRIELIIRTLLCDQLLVGTALDDLAVIKNHDDV